MQMLIGAEMLDMIGMILEHILAPWVSEYVAHVKDSELGLQPGV